MTIRRGDRDRPVPADAPAADQPITVPSPAAPTPIVSSPAAQPPATGGVGAVPPPGAPREVSQPLKPEAIAAMAAKARANERTLEPLKPPGQLSPVAEAVAQTLAVEGVVPIAPEGPVPVPLPPAPVASASQAIDPNDDPVTAEPLRGKPQPIVDPGKAITGGFGLPAGGSGAAGYYPLDGTELVALVETLLDEIHAIIHADLRFGIAATYANASVEVKLTIASAGTDEPLEIVARRRESDEFGGVETPADAIRDELGLPKPRKQMVVSGSGERSLVDVV